MSVWKFTTAAGEAYEVQGPPGATYDQALEVFNKQYNSGGLVGLQPGDLLNAVTQSIDGLATAPAYIGPQAISATQQAGGYVALPTQPGATVANAITTSNFVNTNTSSQTIGNVTSPQVQGLIATTAATINQSANVITVGKGLGTYGLTADQLQTAGFIKPGVADQVKKDPANAVVILSSPTSWTGKQGVTDINVILNDANLQTAIEQSLMENAYNQLKQNGTINGTEPASTLGPIVNAATKYGVESAVQSLNYNKITNTNPTATAVAAGVIGFIASSSYGEAFGSINQSLSGGGGALSSGTVQAKGYTNTVNRVNVNQAIKAIIGNPKIPTPYFPSAGTRSSNPAAATAAIQSAISTLTASGLTGAQIVDVINSRSGGADRISTYGGILRSADGTPVTDRSGNPISIGGDSPTLGSGITSADKAAMFSGASSANPGTTNDGVPSSPTSINTGTGTPGAFNSSFNNSATQKAVVSSVLSGSPTPVVGAITSATVNSSTATNEQKAILASVLTGNPVAVIGAITTAAQNSPPTQSATPAVPSATSSTVNGVVTKLKEAAAADPEGFKAALAVGTQIAGAFGPIGSLVAGVLNTTLTPTINQALAAQAEQRALDATLKTAALAEIRAAEQAIDQLQADESKVENDGGFGEARTLSESGLNTAIAGQDAANARDSDPAGFGGSEPSGGSDP